MEPTNRRETGTRPSAWKRYGPFIAIVVVLAIVGVIIAIAGSGGGSDNSNKNKQAASGTDITTAGGPTIINSSNKNSINWGPNCDTKTMRVKIPYTFAASCVQPFTGNNGGA